MAKRVIDIPNIIVDQLLLEGKCSIVGVGTFYNEYVSASFNDDRSKLLPPKEVLKFSTEVDASHAIQDFAVNSLGIKAKKVDKNLSSFAEGIINAVLNYGQSDIEGVGTLKLNAEGEMVLIKTQEESIAKYFGLPSVDIKPIKFIKSEQKLKSAVEDQAVVRTEADEETAFGMKHLLLSLLMALGMFGLYHMMTGSSDSTEQGLVKEEQAIQKQESAVEKEVLDTVVMEEVTTPNEEVQSIEDSADPKEAAALAKNKNKGKLVECVIILGAYESERNIQQMYDKVIKLGYEPYKEYFDTMGVTRVGFTFTCEDKDLRSLMKEVRQKVSKDAWYLVPRITID